MLEDVLASEQIDIDDETTGGDIMDDTDEAIPEANPADGIDSIEASDI
jgi:hypothetical protein